MDFQYAEGWRPNEGDILIGTVVEVSRGASEWGSYPIVTVKPDEGEPVAVHAFHTGLMNRLIDLKPQPGERIGFKYEGKHPTKDGKRTVARYQVRIEGRKTTDVWTQMERQQEPQQAFQSRSDVPVSAEDFKPSGAPRPDDDIPF